MYSSRMNDQDTIRLRNSLLAPLPEYRLPPGIVIAGFNRCQARQAHALMVEAYQAGGGDVAAFDAWWSNLVNDDEYDETSFFVALDQTGRMVGLAQCWRVPFVKDLVVAADWRRKGLGEALLLHAFSFFQRKGEPYIDLKVDRDNPSGAMRLYSRVGMKPIQA